MLWSAISRMMSINICSYSLAYWDLGQGFPWYTYDHISIRPQSYCLHPSMCCSHINGISWFLHIHCISLPIRSRLHPVDEWRRSPGPSTSGVLPPSRLTLFFRRVLEYCLPLAEDKHRSHVVAEQSRDGDVLWKTSVTQFEWVDPSSGAFRAGQEMGPLNNCARL